MVLHNVWMFQLFPNLSLNFNESVRFARLTPFYIWHLPRDQTAGRMIIYVLHKPCPTGTCTRALGSHALSPIRTVFGHGLCNLCHHRIQLFLLVL